MTNSVRAEKDTVVDVLWVDRGEATEAFDVAARLYAIRFSWTSDPEQALELVRSREPAFGAVVVASNIAGADGCGLVSSIRRDPATHRTPILVLLEADDSTALDRAIDAGADSWLAKPFSMTNLLLQLRLLRVRALLPQPLARQSRHHAWMRYLIHDLRNHLTAVRTLVAVAERSVFRGSVGDVVETLADIRYSASLACDMMSDFLDIERFEHGSVILRRQTFSLQELLGEETRRVRSLAKERGVAIELVEPAQPAVVDGDRGLLRRVLANLVDNGLRYAPSRTALTIEIDLRTQGKVRLAFTNRGKAIPTRDRERIFEPFIRLDETAEATGCGLGLAFSRRVIEAHGGRIWVEEPEGGGARFVVLLPIGD